MADNSARIAEIRTLLGSGAKTVKVDGVETTFDLASLRKELRELMREDDTQAGRRPTVSTINLGGF